MLILGVNLGFKLETQFNKEKHIAHDAAAVLLQDGKIVAAIEEERLSRVKHCNFFPRRAITACLEQAGASLADVSHIGINLSEMDAQRYAQIDAFEDVRVPLRTARGHFAALFRQCFPVDVADRLVFCQHHETHAWSAFAVSGFESCAVLVLDGGGSSGNGDDKFVSGILGVARRNNFEVLREFTSDQSLGNFYCHAIKLIGYELFDEYKVMGLAPYGDPARFRAIFSSLYSLEPDGNYRIQQNYLERLFFRLSSEFGFLPVRRKGDAFAQIHKDFAAALQEAIETIVLHVAAYARDASGLPDLAYAGGVAHNCTLNGKMRKAGLFERIFVQPAAHDAGCALGAALYAQAKVDPTVEPDLLGHLYFGPDLPDSATIEQELQRWAPLISIRKSENVTKDTAALLASGAVVGWVQGRSEFGPRALGNRSILADPRPESNKSRINQMIKKREAYRPFAPSVMHEHVTEIFDAEVSSDNLLFMNMVVSVNEGWRERLGAVTHVDHTARVQVVRQSLNPRYWALIADFAKLTGVPVLLNTSFNNNNEPIVDSLSDAVASFLTTDLTLLVVGDHIVSKAASLESGIGHLVISAKPSLKITFGFDNDHGALERAFRIESTYGHRFGQTSSQISPALFRLLTLPGQHTLESACAMLGTDLDADLIAEIIDRWCDRLITLEPMLTGRGSG